MNHTTERIVDPRELPEACNELLRSGARMRMAYAWHPKIAEPPEVLYLANQAPHQPFALVRCRLEGKSNKLPSLATIAPLLSWYEREMHDLFGIDFAGHPEPHPLVLHEGAKPPMPPLDPRYQPADPMPFDPCSWKLPAMYGKDIQWLPFGPVRGDVLESAQIGFFYIGEGILHCHPRLFFKHRGMEKRFEGLDPLMGMILAERVSGVDSVAHALAYCQAVEGACELKIPPRARYLRVVLAEMERLYNHLHYLGHLCHTTSLKVGEAEGKLLEEQAKQLNARFTGSRFLRSVLAPGGLRRDLQTKDLSGLLHELEARINIYAEKLETTNSHLDRLLTTGPLPRKIAFDEGASGPIKRASGINQDLRRDQPYAAYGEFEVKVPVRTAGDAHARAQVRIAEIEASITLIQRVLAALPGGAVRNDCQTRPGTEGLGWAESSRGSIYYAVHCDRNGRLARVKIKSPSFSNWRVFPFTVQDSNMMDYAINEASFGLTMAGCDR